MMHYIVKGMNTWQVFFDKADGDTVIESEWSKSAYATIRVHFLNGGSLEELGLSDDEKNGIIMGLC